MKSGNLNFLEPSGPLQACNRTALPCIHHHDIGSVFMTDMVPNYTQIYCCGAEICRHNFIFYISLYEIKSQNNVVSILTEPQAAWSVFKSWQGHKIYPCFRMPRLAWGPIQHHIQWVPGVISPGRTHKGCEANSSHLRPRSEMRRALPVFPLCAFMVCTWTT